MIPRTARWPLNGNMHTRIFLIGFMGSGKTTLGRKLAKKLGYKFVDMDDLIVQTSGMTIPGIFAEHGEALFRKWESDVLMEVIRQEQIVVATGGGAPCFNNNIDVMNENGLTIYLQLSPEAIMDRLQHSKTERPLVKGKSDEELIKYIKDLLETRDPHYLKSRLIIRGMDLSAEHLSSLVDKIESFG